mmetsp:Transcript_33056/g.87385  ORF Transcript_33056/g.87385 Transcript_33056/m.87385 type:complete len:235 (+) Transcript_33056:317-1021(+)
MALAVGHEPGAELLGYVPHQALVDQHLLLPVSIRHVRGEKPVEHGARACVEQRVLLEHASSEVDPSCEERSLLRVPTGFLLAHPLHRVHDVEQVEVQHAPQQCQRLVESVQEDGEDPPREQPLLDEALDLQGVVQPEVVRRRLVGVPVVRHLVVRQRGPWKVRRIVEACHDERLLDQRAVGLNRLVEEEPLAVVARVALRRGRRALHDRPGLDVEGALVRRPQHVLSLAPCVPE